MENLGVKAMSNDSAANLLGPSRWGNTGNPETTPYSRVVEESSSDILASHFESADGIAIVQEIVSARYRLGVNRGSILAQRMSTLGPEAIAHLYQDPELEETCLRVYGRQPGQLDVTLQDQNIDQTTVDVITTPIINISTDDIFTSTAMSDIRSDTDAISGQHAALRRSKSVGSPPSVPPPPPPIPRKPDVKCPRSECRNRIFYKTHRGLREHLMLKHALSADHARRDTELAFIAFHDTVPRTARPQHLGLREYSCAPPHTRPQRDQGDSTHDILAIGDQSSISAAIDPAPHSVPLDTSIISTWPQKSSLPHVQRIARQGQGLHQLELQASITSALRRNQATFFQPVPQAATTSTPVLEHQPCFWTNDVVLSSSREPRYSLAMDNHALSQAEMQQYIPQRYDTWQYRTQQYGMHQNGAQRSGVQQRSLQQHDQQQDEDNNDLDESTFPSDYMRWNHDS